MIIENNTKLIVMLCKLEENNRIKCHDYFPQKLGDMKIYDEMKIELISTSKVNDLSDLRERIFHITDIKLEKINVKEPFVVKQIHFTGWPDHGVPEVNYGFRYYSEMFNYVTKELKDEENNTPPVIHCSAGIGRTGTFISSYTLFLELTNQYKKLLKISNNEDLNNDKNCNLNKNMLENLNINSNKKCKTSNNINDLKEEHSNNFKFSIFYTVMKMKDSRCYSVENEFQYKFIYQYLIKLLKTFKIKK